MDKQDALHIARKVKAQKRRDEKERDALIEEFTKATVDELGCKAEDVEVQLLGVSGADHVIYVWDRSVGVADAYRFPLV